MLIRIEGSELPGRNLAPGPDDPDGRENVHVAIQGRKGSEDLLGVLGADAASAQWEIDGHVLRSLPDVDLRGPQIQGHPGSRFIYLSWGTVSATAGFEMFRRAKLLLDAVPDHVMAAAIESGLLVGRLGLTDESGWPLCAAVRPPRIEWSAS